MPLFAKQVLFSWPLMIGAAAFWGFIGVWTFVAIRLALRQPVLPYQPRRPVPWRAIDMALVAIVYLLIQTAVLSLALVFLDHEALQPPKTYDLDQISTTHTLTRLITENNVWILGLCGLSAVVIAPITEEFLFRLLLQGGLESAQRRWRRRMPVLRRLVPGAIGPILIVSLLFARVHFRVASPAPHVSYLVFLAIGVGVSNVLTMAFAVVWLRSRVGATAADFGWVRGKFFADVGLGVLTFLGLYGPILVLQYGFMWLLPRHVSPDPFTLFFFALALGILYYRTHRIVPAIALHMSLNALTIVNVLVLMPQPK